MPALILINTTTVVVNGSTNKLLPGDTVADFAVQSSVRLEGGQLVVPSAGILAAAAVAQKLRHRGADESQQLAVMLAAFTASSGSGGPTTEPPYTQADPLAPDAQYTILSTDGVLYCAAGALVLLPASPVVGREYLVKIASGTAEETPARVFAGGAYEVEDPGADAPYTLVGGATPATLKTSGVCSGWTFDGTTMNLTR